MAIIRRGMDDVLMAKMEQPELSNLIWMALKWLAKLVRFRSNGSPKLNVNAALLITWKGHGNSVIMPFFTGYAPFDNPKYAIAVIVEHGGSGSSSAAPVARDIMTYLFEQGL